MAEGRAETGWAEVSPRRAELIPRALGLLTTCSGGRSELRPES